ncbi:hypothetical protein PIROE2DRAFT_15758 [Piromyces sp. E2]|nr:hypothetical protein PIROE2DRAFT_15758 [Piromyces sp. E2]|eukprot:OUM58883.1 hypothetical protein PIROE2DRAFT_15758 [Piromyces sp. E2]
MEYENSKYNKCMPGLDLTNYKESCSDIESEECQDFYRDTLKYYPICKDLPDFREVFQPLVMELMLQGYESSCLTNEEGDLCPFSIFFMTDSQNTLDALHDQCQSKKCTDSLIKIYKDKNIDQYVAFENLPFSTGSFTYQELKAKDNILSVLESDECQSSHVTSNAITIATNNIFLIILILYFFY